jgi:hypothetical protein
MAETRNPGRRRKRAAGEEGEETKQDSNHSRHLGNPDLRGSRLLFPKPKVSFLANLIPVIATGLGLRKVFSSFLTCAGPKTKSQVFRKSEMVI